MVADAEVDVATLTITFTTTLAPARDPAGTTELLRVHGQGHERRVAPQPGRRQRPDRDARLGHFGRSHRRPADHGELRRRRDGPQVAGCRRQRDRDQPLENQPRQARRRSPARRGWAIRSRRWAASGTHSFQAGASSGTIEVAVLDDAHDEGEETLTPLRARLPVAVAPVGTEPASAAPMGGAAMGGAAPMAMGSQVAGPGTVGAGTAGLNGALGMAGMGGTTRCAGHDGPAFPDRRCGGPAGYGPMGGVHDGGRDGAGRRLLRLRVRAEPREPRRHPVAVVPQFAVALQGHGGNAVAQRRRADHDDRGRPRTRPADGGLSAGRTAAWAATAARAAGR